NPPKMLGGNANAVIVHCKAIVARLLCTSNRNLRRLASSNKFEGITQEIAKNLGQAYFWIEHCRQELRHMNGGPRIDNFELQVMKGSLEDLADIHGHRLRVQAPDARILQQAIQELFHVQGIVNDLFTQLTASAVEDVTVVLQEPACVAFKCSEGGLQIVAGRV